METIVAEEATAAIPVVAIATDELAVTVVSVLAIPNIDLVACQTFWALCLSRSLRLFFQQTVSKAIETSDHSFHGWFIAKLIVVLENHPGGDIAQALVGIRSRGMDKVDCVHKLVSRPCKSCGFFELLQSSTLQRRDLVLAA